MLIWTVVGLALVLAPIVTFVMVLELRDRVRLLGSRVGELERTAARLVARPPAERAPAPAPAPPPAGAAPPPPPPVDVERPARPVEEPAAVAAEPEPAGAQSWGQLEMRLGGTWLNRVGVVVLVLGIGFFLKYAFDNAWIGPSGRVATGILAGVGLLLLGERLQRDAYRVPAQGVSAAGIATLYMSAYAAYAFYQLVSQSSAFAFMVLVTATGMALAIHHDTRAIAVLANLGGFLTPVLLGSNRDAAITLFTYLAILDAGMLASAYWRRWTELRVLSFVFTQALYAAWFERWYQPYGSTGSAGEPQRMIAFAGATVFLVLFALIAPLEARGRRPAGRLDDLRNFTALLALAAPVAYFLAAREILYPGLRTWLGLVCLALAAVYLLLGQWALRAPAGGAPLALLHWALALAFLTLTFPVQFTRHGVTIAWSVQGAALVWGGFRLGAEKLRAGALVVLGLALASWAMVLEDRPAHDGLFVADSPAFLPAVFFVAAALVAALLYHRSGTAAGWEAYPGPALVVAALGASALFATLELDRHPLGLPLAYVSVATTLVWVAAAIPMLALARRDRTRVLLVAATVTLIGVGVGALTANVDRWRLLEPELRTPVLNLRFLSGLLIVALYALYARLAPELPVDAAVRRRLQAVAAAAAGVFLLLHLSAEIAVMRLEDWVAGDTWKVRNMGLSILWTLYAFAAMGVGIRRDQAYLRTGAIGLFALTLVKVFLVDLSRLDAVYRILSFVVLGGVLVLVSFLYTKHRGRLGQGTR
jgi:uncharacterized membrane protein